MKSYKELTTITLTNDVPEHGLLKGQIGTVLIKLSAFDYMVEVFDHNDNTIFIDILASSNFSKL